MIGFIIFLVLLFGFCWLITFLVNELDQRWIIDVLTVLLILAWAFTVTGG